MACRDPTVAEIGEALGLSVRQVERSLSLRGMSSVFMSAAPPGTASRTGAAKEVPSLRQTHHLFWPQTGCMPHC